MMVCFLSYLDIIGVLVYLGVNVNVSSENGMILLMFVFLNDDNNVICIFVKRGVKVNQKSFMSKIVLYFVVFNGNVNVVWEFLK